MNEFAIIREIFAKYGINIENKSLIEVLDEMNLKLNSDSLTALNEDIFIKNNDKIFGGLTNGRERN